MDSFMDSGGRTIYLSFGACAILLGLTERVH